MLSKLLALAMAPVFACFFLLKEADAAYNPATVAGFPSIGSVQALGSAAQQYPNIEVLNYNSDGSNKFFSLQSPCPSAVSQVAQISLTGYSSACYVETPPAPPLLFINTPSMDGPPLGSELTSATGWTSTGWTGSYAAGFTHSTGNTDALSFSIPSMSIGAIVTVTVTVSGCTAGDSTAVVGGAGAVYSSATLSTLCTAGTWTWGVVATNTTGIVFTPTTNFNGTISNISVKYVSASQANLTWNDSTDTLAHELRTPPLSSNNLFFGDGDGRYVNSGTADVAFGDGSLSAVISSTHAVAFGYEALGDLVNGNYMTAVGSGACRHDTASHDVCIGDQTLYVGSGGDNTVVGSVGMNTCTTCTLNAGLGAGVMGNITTGYDNTGSGASALGNCTSCTSNAADGYEALLTCTTCTQNYAGGAGSLGSLTTGYQNTSTGTASLNACTTCYLNVANGYEADVYDVTGNSNVSIGPNSGAASGNTALTNIIAIGSNAQVSNNSEIMIGNCGAIGCLHIAAGNASGSCEDGSAYLNNTASGSTDILWVCGNGSWVLVK